MNKLWLTIRKRKKAKPKPGRPRKIDPVRFLNALSESFGITSTIADRLGVTYKTLKTYIDNASEDILELIAMEKQKIADVAEVAVVEMAMQSLHFPTKLNASKFILVNGPNASMKGYKNIKELTIEGGKRPVQIQNEHLISMEKLKTYTLADRKQMLLEMAEQEDEYGGE